jgi:hypothetical protein
MDLHTIVTEMLQKIIMNYVYFNLADGVINKIYHKFIDKWMKKIKLNDFFWGSFLCSWFYQNLILKDI